MFLAADDAGLFDWIAVAHRTTRAILALSVIVTAVHCAQAASGGGTRIGSKSVGVRHGTFGVATQVTSKRVDPDHVPSSRMLNARGVTSVESLRSGDFAWAALTRTSFEIPVRHPPRGAWIAVVASGAISLAPWLFGMMLVERILRRSRRRDPFAAANLRDLRLLALLVSAGVYLGIVVDFFVARWVSHDASVGLNLNAYYQEIGVRLSVPLLPLVSGALVLAAGEVWRRGIQLREDVDATV